MRTLALSLVLAMVSPIASSAAECRFRSGAQTAALLELYTSEGCSSCPPADRWLSGFAQGNPAPGLVPIAFHVAYWDYLGWKDVFADERFTERQRQLARVAGARSVYTPQVVLAGRDFPQWRGGGAPKAFTAVNARPARAHLEIVTQAIPSARVTATLATGVRAADVGLFVALTQNGLATKVRAGENRGELLRHDFVARDLVVARGWSSAPTPAISTTAAFTPRPEWKPEQMRFVAFVQDLKTGEVLQALAAPLCPAS